VIFWWNLATFLQARPPSRLGRLIGRVNRFPVLCSWYFHLLRQFWCGAVGFSRASKRRLFLQSWTHIRPTERESKYHIRVYWAKWAHFDFFYSFWILSNKMVKIWNFFITNVLRIWSSFFTYFPQIFYFSKKLNLNSKIHRILTKFEKIGPILKPGCHAHSQRSLSVD
jgi:hypothetical protein